MTERGQAAELLGWLSGKPQQPQDWPSLLNLAGETLTISELAEVALESTAVELPPPVADLLADIRARTHLRNRRLMAQLSEAVEALNAVGVEPIVMKGMARLLTKPGDQGRLISDIDLLIPAGRHGECELALKGLGYTAQKGSVHAPVVLERPVDVGQIDLHVWIPPGYLRFDFDRLRPHCNAVGMGRARAFLPSPTCQMLLIVVHDQLHDTDYWRGLVDVRHLIDIRKLAREEIDWALLEEMLPEGPARRALAVQLCTAQRFVDAQVDPRLCGGRWTAVQLARRRYQARNPWLLPPLTLLTLMVEPPRHASDLFDANWREWVWNRLRMARHYLRSPAVGKLRSV